MYRGYRRLPTSRITEMLLITHGNSAKSIYVDAFVCVCVCVCVRMHSCICVLSPLESPISFVSREMKMFLKLRYHFTQNVEIETAMNSQ